ncbi:hypothetical protein [Paludibacterium denitrificans]|uniref:hypothetical protein n=1 Tax=Paludibacterium denitrificans TaxID=2675226 RepID=UPI001E519294|nr:hypothetical protein [Paludibacterium denitrificans]
MTQDTNASLENFFSNLSETNQKWMQQFVNTFTGGLPANNGVPANPMTDAWSQMLNGANQFVAMQSNLYQQQMNLWMQFLGQKKSRNRKLRRSTTDALPPRNGTKTRSTAS